MQVAHCFFIALLLQLAVSQSCNTNAQTTCSINYGNCISNNPNPAGICTCVKNMIICTDNAGCLCLSAASQQDMINFCNAASCGTECTTNLAKCNNAPAPAPPTAASSSSLPSSSKTPAASPSSAASNLPGTSVAPASASAVAGASASTVSGASASAATAASAAASVAAPPPPPAFPASSAAAPPPPPTNNPVSVPLSLSNSFIQVTESVVTGSYVYYSINFGNLGVLNIRVEDNSGSTSLYVSFKSMYPTLYSWELSDNGHGTKQLIIEAPSRKRAEKMVYIGVYGKTDSRFTLSASVPQGKQQEPTVPSSVASVSAGLFFAVVCAVVCMLF